MLFINNDDVKRVLTIDDALRVLADGHRELAEQALVARPQVGLQLVTVSSLGVRPSVGSRPRPRDPDGVVSAGHSQLARVRS